MGSLTRARCRQMWNCRWGGLNFYDLPDFEAYGLYEEDMLRRYLNKDHGFRQGMFSVSKQGRDHDEHRPAIIA